MKKTIIVLFILFTVSTLAFASYKFDIFSSEKSSNINNNSSKKDVDLKTTYDFVYPKKSIQVREIIGKFIANDFVSIYSRRDAIIQDIFVDIGDKIKQGQVLATLFDVGVSGQAQSNINEKNELLKAKQIELKNSINVKEHKISELNQKINEQYTLLELANKNKDVKVNQVQNLLNNTLLTEDDGVLLKKQAIEIEKKSLELLEKNLEDAISSKNSKLRDLENKKKQIIDNSFVVIDESFDKIIKLIYLGNDRVFSDNTFLNNNDISIYLSAKNTNIRNDFFKKVQDFYVLKAKLGDVEELFNNLEEIYLLAPSVIDNTIISTNISQSLLDNLRSSIFLGNTSIIKQKSEIENIENSFETTTKIETEKINSLQNNISKQKEIIILKQKELELTLSSQNKTNINLENELEKIEINEYINVETILARIKVLEENLSLLKVQEQKNIEDIENSINISTSALNTAVSIYGNNQIISPFDGIISKRNINVGGMISSSMSAFEMLGVSTSLSNKSSKEVIFNIPQELKDYVEIGKEISFVGVTDSSISYSGSIWRISPQIDLLNNTIQVQAKINDDNISLPHNSDIRVILDVNKNYLTVPFKSIYNKDGKKAVYFLRDSGNLGYRYINIVDEIGEMVNIEGIDLDETYKIVTTPLYFDN